MTTQPAYLTLGAGTNYYLTLNDPAPYDNDVSLLLAEAVWYIDSHNANFYGPVPNAGTAGTALNAQIGSTASGAVQVVPSSGYVYLPGVAGNYLSVPDEAALDITGDIDIRVKVALDDWTPAGYASLISKRATVVTTDASYELFIAPGGKINFQWFDSGTAGYRNHESSAIVGATDGTFIWVRAGFDADNGSGGCTTTFYTSTDGSSWTQLGTAQTTATVAAIQTSGSQIELGSFNNGATSVLAGSVYRAIVKNGIDGTTVLDVDCADASTQSPLFTASTGQTVTINVSGADTNDPKWLAYDPADGAYIYLPGETANYLSVPDEAALDITGDIDIRVKVALDDWTPATFQSLVAKSSVGSQYSYELGVYQTTGTLFVNLSTNGTGWVTKQSTVATGIADGATKWVRATVDVDNGASGYDIKFWTSDDGVAWTQLGATVTTATAIALNSGSGVVQIGSNESSSWLAGSVYRAIVKNGIDGTTVLDIDTSVLTSGSATSFTATTGQTVTVNRSTLGRKTTLVGGWAGGGSLWLFGTDDYLEVPDNDAIDFGASDSFTVLAVVRAWATIGGVDPIVSKKVGIDYTTGAGYSMYGDSSQPYFSVADGTFVPTATPYTTYSNGVLNLLVAVRNVSADTVALNFGGATYSVTDTTTATLANAKALKVGGNDNAEYADMEFVAAAIFRRALTAGEIAGLNLYFQERAYNG